MEAFLDLWKMIFVCGNENHVGRVLQCSVRNNAMFFDLRLSCIYYTITIVRTLKLTFRFCLMEKAFVVMDHENSVMRTSQNVSVVCLIVGSQFL